MKEGIIPSNEQVRLAHQFEHALQSYFYTRDIIEENGEDGMVFNTNVDGERTELCVDANMLAGLKTARRARSEELKATGRVGVALVHDVFKEVYQARKGT